MSSAMRRTYVRGVTGIAAALLAIAGCGGGDGPPSTPATSGPTTTLSLIQEQSRFILSMCLTDTGPGDARRLAEAKGWSADDVEFVVDQLRSCP